ncbi:E3 ubiquitin/ISG15 ligase TRIM25-like [Acanthopagrus latus]|uniref:E3 ubiquitin/ISG15 ligase TRIM25-like n=1 Tax=Acanthopagrus latus TaxID=8177 RepID=UPI00187C491C|nr:E3 ubiquitin/ISG15 ligase TRIM25-like [Acanthopagrus latus]XP_036942867.1 E3 ubiquitin/ISG15 ligase TRIM25-like [Acanthopagrus latus]XP_036948293.1 E3 ubiquitin/ISG15 ligase TRIM25-like [Acanthopagrus latus]
MADTEQSQFSLMSLEDELTCSICLSPFDCPVTIPCGHNFCQGCLLSTWTDTYSCPQCRTLFETIPELKKNTVLSSVVQTFCSTSLVVEESKAEKDDVVRCDTCMEAEAAQTCLTCMASFCEEHLRPHRENPTFRVHQLIEPIGNLSEHICADHHKLMEFFCSQHGRPICSLCLQQVHKGCTFISPEEQRSLKETDLREKLGLLDMKIEKTETVMFQINDMQSKLKEAATKRKTAFAAVFQQMRDMLAQEEREAQHEVDHELETGQMKLRDLMKRLTENTENMRKAREDINGLLSQSQTLAFLQASFDLPRATKFEPHTPRINLDSKKVTATQAFASSLKDHLTEIFKQPVEARLVTLNPDESAAPVSGSAGSQLESEQADPPEQSRQTTSIGPGCPPIQPFFQPVPVPVYIGQHGGWSTPQYRQGQAPGSYKGPPFRPGQKTDKKSDTGHHSSHKQVKKPQSASGGKKPSGKGSDSTKKDNPKSHPSSGKPAGPHPRPHKNK